MADPVAARKYLEASLPLGQWAAASHAIGHDHAYIQQYIRRGVPRYLNEVDRDQLVKLYGLDADRLRPPPRTANLTRFRDLMVDRGLITRTADPDERRKLAISRTPAGEQLAKQLAPQLTSYMTRLYRDFSDADRVQFMEYLKRLVGALDTISAEDAAAQEGSS